MKIIVTIACVLAAGLVLLNCDFFPWKIVNRSELSDLRNQIEQLKNEQLKGERQAKVDPSQQMAIPTPVQPTPNPKRFFDDPNYKSPLGKNPSLDSSNQQKVVK